MILGLQLTITSHGYEANDSWYVSWLVCIILDWVVYIFDFLPLQVEVRNVNSLEPADNTTVTITLKDINDHQPHFKKNNYRFHANSTTKGTFVGQVSIS